MATPIIMPKQGNTVEECLLSEWKIKLGDNIAVGDIIADIETDKTTGEVEATASGIVLALFWEEGDLIPVFQNICVVGEAGEDVAEFAPTDEDGDDTATPVEEENAEDQAAPKDEPTAPVTAASGAAPLSPRARAFIKNHPTNLSAVVGSGADGRIIEKDVADAYHGGARLSTTAAAKLASGEGAPASGSGVGGMVMGNDMG
ncbi:MAG: E3 binding domain-containing protein, partial [Lentisphaeria bacterium]|nr:E3 binding domain-containing protein [Lentisphaeria bacterium]